MSFRSTKPRVQSLSVLFAALFLIAVGLSACSSTPSPNPEAALKLGTYLFFDERMSGDGSISCSTCHNPNSGYAEGQALSETYPASEGFRNTPTLVHSADRSSFYRDGRLEDVSHDEVVRDMITGKLFLNVHEVLLTERMKQIPVYDSLFQAAFGKEPTFEGIVDALALFQASIIPSEYPEKSEAAVRGESLFQGAAGCASCHSGPDFSDGLAHNMGVPDNPLIANDPMRTSALRLFLRSEGVEGFETATSDPGRFIVTGDEADRGAFLTPSLRQVAHTPPYMHNGVFGTLEEVLTFYASNGHELSESDQSDLIAYLTSLSGTISPIESPALPPYAVSANWMEEEN